jgi:hypothetical protein
MVFPFLTPAVVIALVTGLEGAKEPSGEVPPPDSDPFSDNEFEKISPACQADSPPLRIAASSSKVYWRSSSC